MFGAKRKRLGLGAGLLVLTTVVSAHSWGSQAASELPAAPSAVKAGTTTPPPAPWSAKKSTAPRDLVSQEGWPREVISGQNTFTVYQPQLDSWDGAQLEAYAAVSVKHANSQNPTYGVLRFSAQTEVDKENRLVTLTDFNIHRVTFPAAPDQEPAYLAAIQKTVITKTRLMALDRLEAALAILKAEEKALSVPVKNDPPVILFSTVPAMLIYIDGAPAYRPAKDTLLRRVINTRALILEDATGKHYLHMFDGWLQAPTIGGPWTAAHSSTAELEKALKDAIASGQVDLLSGKTDPKKPGPSLSKVPPPAIYVATTPAELIVTEGNPKYVPIEGTQLIYAENTTGHIFRHQGDQKTYVLISGRWFRADSFNGPWDYVKGGDLPPDFAKIPDTSPKENVKASVPGTPQSMEALIADGIPQTAAVNRKQAKMAPPKFDGEPQFQPIEGTPVQYVVNSAWPIIRVDGNSYYAVENGIWFVASSLNGPWVVADSVPAVIYSIPPSSPLYNVTYVKVYRSTPDLIYVGYTAGYYGTCVSHGSGAVVVYGTGYRYTPWVGSTWYGPPLTYGYGSALTFTPWTGWTYGFGFGWTAPTTTTTANATKTTSNTTYATTSSSSSNVSVSFYYGWGPYPWWGPYGWGYYYPYPYYYPYYYPAYGAAWGPYGAVAWGPGGWAATTGNVYHRWGNTSAVTRTSGGYNAWTGNAWARQVGAGYNSRTGTIAAGQRGSVGNVYTGNYAYGGRGVIHSTETGRTVTGGKVTVGNTGSGESGSAAWLRGEQGGVARVGDDIYAAHDGTVYRKTEDGWQSNSGSGWGTVERPDTPRPEPYSGGQRTDSQRPTTTDRQAGQGGTLQRPSTSQTSMNTGSLDRQYSARQTGSQRTQGYRSGSYRSTGGRTGGSRGRR